MSKAIKYLVMDVDGTLTDGKIYMGPNGEAMKAFSIKDGYAINFILKPVSIVPIIITARTSSIVQHRCNELGIKEVYQGKMDKFVALKEIIGEKNIGSCAYFGDDVIDLKCMKPIKEKGGIIGCPADAVREVKAISDYICINKAGEGALREFSEWLVGSRKDVNNIKLKIDSAIEYMKNLDIKNLEQGIIQVNDDFYYSIQEYFTKPVNECKLESHRKYIDIQWILEGEEAIEIADIGGLRLAEQYSEEKDIMFWIPTTNMMRILLKKGTYVILYPRNAHMGCIAVNESSKVKKLVGKIRI